MEDPLGKPLWREHFGLLVSGGLAAFVILRLLGVSYWDLTTALAIASASGTASVALSSVLASLPALYSAAVLFLLPTLWARLASRTKIERTAVLTGISFPILLVLYLAPLVTMLIGLAGLAVLWILIRRGAARRRESRAEGKDAPEPEPPSQFERSAALAGALVVLFSTTVSTPWFPTENLGIGEEANFTGYVISSRDQDVVVLRDVTRVIVVTQASGLTRALCSKDDPSSKTAMQFLTRPKYPACPQQWRRGLADFGKPESTLRSDGSSRTSLAFLLLAARGSTRGGRAKVVFSPTGSVTRQ